MGQIEPLRGHRARVLAARGGFPGQLQRRQNGLEDERQLLSRELVEQVVDLCLARLDQIVARVDPAIVAGPRAGERRAVDTGPPPERADGLRGGFSISASRL